MAVVPFSQGCTDYPGCGMGMRQKPRATPPKAMPESKQFFAACTIAEDVNGSICRKNYGDSALKCATRAILGRIKCTVTVIRMAAAQLATLPSAMIDPYAAVVKVN